MCNYNDCGWCYAPDNVNTNAEAGACNKPEECPQYISLVEEE